MILSLKSPIMMTYSHVGLICGQCMARLWEANSVKLELRVIYHLCHMSRHLFQLYPGQLAQWGGP